MATNFNVDREIRTTAVDFSFGEILNLHNDEEIVIRPEYQRLFRWTNSQRSRLIESILIGLPIPPIFLVEDADGVLELIDGLQRISSVLQFLNHQAISEPVLVLEGCDFLKDLNGKTYEDLPTVQKLKIKRNPIRAIIINKSGDSFVKYEMFKRLNTGGSLLSSQEIRNCSSRMVEGGGEFYSLLQECANDENFKIAIHRLPNTEKEKRADEELVLRFFALIYARNMYKGNIEEWLDSYMEGVLFKEIDFDTKEGRDNFKECFRIIVDKFNDEAFTRFNERGEAIGRLAPAYFEAVCGAVSANKMRVQSMESKEALTLLRAAFSDDEFKEATGPGANTIAKLAKRINVVEKHFQGNVSN